ncbi:hypothetical protein BJ741DRAFT_634238 [Chytriomyces cf. hyalinus JEL632]|nr:hypothetical protein BJ741DRAFT_634238 [Chytriomyces cf. hyalinus JEL632]
MSKSMYAIPPAAGPYTLDAQHESGHHVPNRNTSLASNIAANLEPRKSVAGYIPTPNRSDRKLQFGIDCAELVHFSHWEPGGEHVQNLVIKNVVMKTQKIKYKLPKTRFFSMDFPETVTLSAGMSWTIPITFRPVAKECYTDAIEFTTSFGRFLLPIKATLPEHVLEHPPSIDFTLCPIRETARRTFSLKNVGELGSTFEWEISSPFRIAPRIGTLNPGQSVTIAIDFHPENASVFTAVAVCNFGDKNQWERSKVTQVMTVYGIGKYSHLSIEGASSNFNFGRVFIGKRLEKRFNIWNHSDVPSNFRIVRAEKNTEPYFQFSTTAGTIAPHKNLEISITYIPVAAGMDSTEYFDIATVSGNTIHITCSGVGAGPCVSLNTSLVNFNDVQANTTCMRPIYIQNDAAVTAFYQFLTEPNSLFRIDKPWGTIGPNSSVALTIRFTPKEPINYYRRVYCLVEHQDALYVEFIGTCYNDKRRPATFHPKMLENYRLRVQNGLWSFGPEHLEEMLKSGTIQCRDGFLSFSNLDRQKDVEHEILDYPYNDGLISSEYFYENTGSDQAVTLMDTYIDFGSCSKYRVIDHQTIRIRNNTRGKMSCVWHMPGENLSSEETVFTVTPAIADIAPKSAIEFHVHFRPRTDNSFFGQQLECFVHFKSMRNFRLVNDDTFTPPWCLTPTVAGNTFPAGQDTFIPKIEFGATRLEFPASHVDKSAYRTVRISNTGDTPVKFAFADTDNKKDAGIGGGTRVSFQGGPPFSVKPRIGLLQKNESRLVVFRFNPGEQKLYEQALRCCFNSSLSNSYDLQVKGIGFYPQLVFENQNTLFFKPTCVGTIARRNFTARNTSRIAIMFEWKIPKQYSNCVSIDPISGVLPANSSMSLTCTFLPTSEKHWSLRLPCYYSHALEENEITHETKTKRTTLILIGTGTSATISADPTLLNFEAILVNTIVEKEIVLLNPSDADLFYDLEIYKLTRADSWDMNLEDDKNNLKETDRCPLHIETRAPNSIRDSFLEIVQATDVFPARSNHTLKIRACVQEQTTHAFRVYYVLKPQSKYAPVIPWELVPGAITGGDDAKKIHLCDIRALGVYPIVQVTDIRCEGISKSLLWKFFSLNAFNEMLETVQGEEDTSLSGSNAVVVHQKLDEDFDFPTEGVTGGEYKEPPSLDYNFGAAPTGTPASVVHFSLMNPGVVPVEWVYYFPNDLEVEIENWADPGDYTEEQLHTNLILDNSLFSISPKMGVLNPGESAHINMSYNHKFPGLHKLPVVFKLKNGTTRAGKEIILYFIGTTIPFEQKCLHFHSAHHTFAPVSIGTSNPPIQSFRLANHGLMHLTYTIDTAPLQKLKAAEHDFAVFACNKVTGSIPPGGVEFVHWVFRPLEAREYSVDVPITTDDGKTSIITFSGHGIEEPPHIASMNAKSEDTVPSLQILSTSNQIARLSREHINFGAVPLGSQSRDLIVVRNTSATDKISFQWRVPLDALYGEVEHHQCIQITPREGVLEAGESRFVKMVFVPVSNVCVYDLDLECVVVNETQKAAFEHFQETVSIAIREGRLSMDPRTVSPSTTTASKPLLGSAGSSKHALRGSKYSPLPEIYNAGVKAPGISVPDLFNMPLGAVSHKPVDTGIDFDAAPIQPTPQSLFVSVQAQSFTANTFRCIFDGQEKLYHPHRSNYAKIRKEKVVFSDGDQLNLFQSTMEEMMDEIFQDPEVQALVAPLGTTIPGNDGSFGMLPYFAQISTNEKRNGIFLAPSLDASDEGKNETPTGTIVQDLFASEALGARYFQNWVENILESTLYNLIQEANVGEFDVTKECFLLWPKE